MTTRRGEAVALAGLLAVAGVTHLVRPGVYDPIVPRALPGPARFWTYASGVAELAVAATVANPATRRAGGRAAAALFVAVLPANVKMAVDWRRRRPTKRAIAYGRVPLQVPLIWWALRVARADVAGRHSR
ncbi:DoxX family protein [Micromonospora sp. DT228]|uniref:DoxX family protein n=1 Tax=Micromonospora sp. DT228 TaxID=3393443 RepID=UPI003CF775D9